ncbi:MULTISPECIES: cation:proton antiporter [Terrisporobacter]|uniref:Sodium:proton antiporter n=1 Tax=Terrisporobacter muris TaxID=2963284 RepID=A0A9X2ME77_9FIRM|nr:MULTISPECIES: sodium:proton antiporter [Terrisporobacter]MCR1824215.1 sodium:proton antiporter [Terrisporobacter muris]MDU6985171.1 sodium:proton antiporter [Terrisporobacter othiniensis]MDY3372000.1 sodium:proton antiporter [Terrisporobacter othiniensis]
METSIHAIACNKLLILFATIAITGIICSKGSELINIPDVVLFLIVGILLGPSVLKVIDISQFQLENQLILTFGSAFILYLGGKEVSLKVLKNVKISVFLLSTLGVVISSFFMAKIVGFNFQIGFMTCLLAGSIIASTDPATIVPIFNQVKIDKKVKQTVISESALNDATGAIMTVAILSIIMGGHFSMEENIYNLCIMVIVGVIVGLITGLVLLFLVNDSPKGIFKDYTPIISILSVIIAYELSTYLGGSGYMSCFIVGLVTGNKQNFKMWLSQKHYDADCNVVETVGTICRMCIFIILGSQVQLSELFKYFIPSLLSVLGLIFIVRPVCVLACTLVDRKAKWNKKQILFMMWVRETGVIPAALCGIITSMKVPGSEIISSIVFMTILITLILQGSTTKLLAKKLGLLELEVVTNEDEITN